MATSEDTGHFHRQTAVASVAQLADRSYTLPQDRERVEDILVAIDKATSGAHRRNIQRLLWRIGSSVKLSE